MGIRICSLEELEMTVNPNFWRGKRVHVTGHTGFKGSWLAIWLQRPGADVTGIALPPNTSPCLFELAQVAKSTENHICDIRNATLLASLIRGAQAEVVFHLAAQPLVRASYRDPQSTFATNIMGTAHLLDALRGLASARVAVMVTTDKVYQNQEHHLPYGGNRHIGWA